MRTRYNSAAGHFLLACLLFAVTVPASAALDIQRWDTANGARVLMVEVDDLPMVDIRVVFDAGSARDGDNSGLALLTNSLLDEGAGGKTAQQLAESFESVGAEISLESLRDMASVGLRSLSDSTYLDPALASFSDVLTRPDFPRDAFDRQLARFKVAVKSRQQSPADIAEEAFYKALYRDHPYASPVAGTMESLNRIQREDVVAHFKRFYVAQNAVIAIVGDIDRQRAEAIADKLSSGLASGERPPAIPAVKPLDEAVTRFIEYPSQQSHIYIGQPGMDRDHADYFDLYLANHPLGGSGFTSRLVETVREDRGLAYSVYSYFSPMREAGPFIMGMQTRNDQADEAIALLKKELQQYVDEGPGEQELADSISNVTGSFALNLDSNSKVLGYLGMIGFYDLTASYLDDFLDNVRKVNQDSAKRAFAGMIDTGRLVTIVVGQRETAADATADTTTALP